MNFADLGSPFSDYERAEVALLPCPYEGTVSYGKGTKNGPHAIIEASKNLELYDIATNSNPAERGIFTAPAVQPNKLKESVTKLLEDDKFVITLGGEHSISQHAVAAFKEKYENLSVLQIDAHADLRDQFDGSKESHACVMRRIVEMGCTTSQIGIRSMCEEEVDFIKEKNLTVIPWHLMINSSDFQKMLGALKENVYITIDVDAFDCSLMPATGTPEPGGLDWNAMLELLKIVFKQKNVVGCDVVELAPIKGMHSPDYVAAKLVYKLCSMRKVK